MKLLEIIGTILSIIFTLVIISIALIGNLDLLFNHTSDLIRTLLAFSVLIGYYYAIWGIAWLFQKLKVELVNRKKE